MRCNGLCCADRDWQISAQVYLARLGAAEYTQGRRTHVKAGRKASTYRHNPSEYHERMVACLGQNDEEGFKALKLLSLYAATV